MNVSAIDKLRASARDSIRKLSRICEDDDVVELNRFVDIIGSVSPGDLKADVTLGGRLVLSRVALPSEADN